MPQAIVSNIMEAVIFTKNRVVYYTTNNYYNYTVGGNGMLCIEAKNDEYYRVQPVFGNQDGS